MPVAKSGSAAGNGTGLKILFGVEETTDPIDVSPTPETSKYSGVALSRISSDPAPLPPPGGYPVATKSAALIVLADHVNKFVLTVMLGSVKILSGSVAGHEKPLMLLMITADAARLVPLGAEKSISPVAVLTPSVNENEKTVDA
jgi:hypothetical protein